MKIEAINLSNKEKELVAQAAERLGLTTEEAAERLFSEGLATRVRRHIGSVPNVLTLRRGK